MKSSSRTTRHVLAARLVPGLALAQALQGWFSSLNCQKTSWLFVGLVCSQHSGMKWSGTWRNCLRTWEDTTKKGRVRDHQFCSSTRVRNRRRRKIRQTQIQVIALLERFQQKICILSTSPTSKIFYLERNFCESFQWAHVSHKQAGTSKRLPQTRLMAQHPITFLRSGNESI